MTKERGAVADISPLQGKSPDAIAARQAANPDVAHSKDKIHRGGALCSLLETGCLISGPFGEGFWIAARVLR